MHVYFSGIGGVGIGPLALVAKKAGYEVSGSDIKDGQAIKYLRQQGITDINIGQSAEQIDGVHQKKPIDWLVYSSALPKTDLNHPELAFAKQNNIKTSKRDELLNEILSQKNLKLVAIAGTHGKTTTTAMVIWLFKQLGKPVSYSLGAKISFGEMGAYEKESEYFVYECDEFDRNFLAFHPVLAIITGLSWDHHEIFPTLEDYTQAFKQFVKQSRQLVLWQEDAKKLDLLSNEGRVTIESTDDPRLNEIQLAGLYNRRDAWLAIKSVSLLTSTAPQKLVESMNRFPGVSRRFEKIAQNLYSDDAHTPEKIQGCMSVAKELAAKTGQKIIVIYEPLTNRRMHYLGAAHHSVFEGASKIYWLPSYLAREDPSLPVLTPAELIKNLSSELQTIAQPMEMGEELKEVISRHLEAGDMVVGMAGGGADSLDEWFRDNFKD